jgi:putative cell wall-binding protein
MKRFAAILISLVVIISLAAVAFAADTQKGTIKSVDPKAGTITFCPEGTTDNVTLKADKSIDLSKVKPDTKAEVTVDKDTVKGIKELKKPKPAVGC